MASVWTTELKVGVFTLAGLGLIGFGYVYFLDGVRSGEPQYDVTMTLPSADGVYEGTPVRIAGVEVGSVKTIDVAGNQARLMLAIRARYPVPADSIADLRSSGMLGDKYIALDVGRSDAMIGDGGRIATGPGPGDIDAITRKVDGISDDVQAITKVLRAEVEDRDNVDHAEATLANVDAISQQLRLMAEENHREIDAIVQSIGRITHNVDGFTADSTVDLKNEIGSLRSATDKLDGTLADLKSVTGKVDQGQGTIGALVNDRETIDSINDTISDADSVVKSFSGLHAEVYYLGRMYAGTQPKDPAFFYGNPLAPNENGGIGYSGSNTLGMELHPQEDFWWIFEVNDYPQGSISSEEHYFPDSKTSYTEWTRKLDYRFTFQMAKRWHDFSFRLGVKESGGGVGMTTYLLHDKLQLNADVFDFAFGLYPALKSGGLPNLRVGARLEPVHHLWLEAGGEQLLLGARYDYATGYVGAGFHFTDDDIKLLFATLPLNL